MALIDFVLHRYSTHYPSVVIKTVRSLFYSCFSFVLKEEVNSYFSNILLRASLQKGSARSTVAVFDA